MDIVALTDHSTFCLSHPALSSSLPVVTGDSTQTAPRFIQSLKYRDRVAPCDARAVRRIVESTGFFHGHEVDVAVELVEARLAQGEKSGYHFLFCDADGETIGYTCFGPIACTEGSFDLFWIAVDDRHRGKGLGRELLVRTEKIIAAMGGRGVYIETSARPQYEPTRAFYLSCGYQQAALLKDFYALGDHKVIYSRCLQGA